MANLITVKAFSNLKGEQIYSPSISLPINVFKIQDAIANTNSGISGVNTTLNVVYHNGNTTLLGTLLVNETPAQIVTAANAALA